jgi:hypothetical protein
MGFLLHRESAALAADVFRDESQPKDTLFRSRATGRKKALPKPAANAEIAAK